MAHELDIIAIRRNQIAAARTEHEAAIQVLDQESAELDVAERVIARLVASPTLTTHPEKADPALTLPEVAMLVTGRKPPNIPTIPEMIREILKVENELLPRPALTPKQMTDKIRASWWPSVTPTEISPIAWRMAKRKELVKEGPLYRLPTADDFYAGEIRAPEGDEPPDEET